MPPRATKQKRAAPRSKSRTKTTKTSRALPAKRATRQKRSYKGRGSVATKSLYKKTRAGDKRLSARAVYNSGAKIGMKHCYGGSCKRLALRKNGSPYWK